MSVPPTSTVYSFAVCLMLWGCGAEESTPATPSGPKVQVVTGHAKAPPGAFEQNAFTCCATPEAAGIVGAFRDLGAALAADDEPGSTKAAQAFADAMASTTFGGEAAPLQTIGASFRAAGTIAAVRDAYLEASVPMLAYAREHQGGSERFAVGYCSMKPGRWLQSEPELANPYYGSEMLRCGTFEGIKSSSPD